MRSNSTGILAMSAPVKLLPLPAASDEVGYLGLDQAGAAMLFQIIRHRYEKNASTIITSNKPFDEWAHIFAGDPVMASAVLDRLLHRATIINIKGESYLTLLTQQRISSILPG